MGIGNRKSQHSFSQVPSMNQARSVFDRSFATKDTINFDVLVPFYVEEVLPGDTINLSVKTFARLAPQVVPIMDNLYMDYHFFFVPNRLVWNNWQKFMGEQEDPGDSTDYLVPVVNLDGAPSLNLLFGHMGIPGATSGSVIGDCNALFPRAYNLIWNEWFRDQNLQNSADVPKGDGPDLNTLYPLRKRAKKHDYFTSALPWPQKGPAIDMPLGSSAPVTLVPHTTSTNSMIMRNKSTGAVMASQSGMGTSGGGGWFLSPLNTDVALDPNGRLRADLSAATAATINQFREAIMLQSLLELDARGGTRYTEILRAHFGVISPDARLQRPEYLSGGTSFVSQHPVAQTSETQDTPQGNLAAFSTIAEMGNKIGFTKSFVEHGVIIGLVSCRADVTYQQGVNRMWTRRTKWDYFWPKLQELGEQEILNKEIYADGTAADDLVFGYQERYAEYRYRPSEIKGQFRSSYPQTLDVWHMAQNFSTRPALNAAFIESNTPIGRSLVVPDPSYPALLCDWWFDQKHVRPMTVNGVPATLGRF